MKTVFYTIFYYMLALLIGVLAAALVYMIRCDLAFLVAGEKLVFFHGDFFIRGIFVSFPLMASTALLLVVFYGIRHAKKNLWITGTYITLCALTWLFLIPFAFSLEKSYTEKFPAEYEVPSLSQGFFRKNSGGVFYFSRVSENGDADGLFIDLAGITGEAGAVSRFSGIATATQEKEFRSEFADPLISDASKIPFSVSALMKVYSLIVEKARSSWSRGYACYAIFLTFVLALCAAAGLQYVSSWRLANGLFVIITGASVCLLNYGYYMGVVFNEARISWDSYFSSIAVGRGDFLRSFLSSGDILLAVMNLAIFIILLAVWIFLYIFKGKKMLEKQGIEQ